VIVCVYFVGVKGVGGGEGGGGGRGGGGEGGEKSKKGKFLPVKVMRPYKGSRGIAQLIPNLDTRQR